MSGRKCRDANVGTQMSGRKCRDACVGTQVAVSRFTSKPHEPHRGTF